MNLRFDLHVSNRDKLELFMLPSKILTSLRGEITPKGEYCIKFRGPFEYLLQLVREINLETVLVWRMTVDVTVCPPEHRKLGALICPLQSREKGQPFVDHLNTVSIPSEPIFDEGNSFFLTEHGQSRASAVKLVIDRIAKRVPLLRIY